LLSGIGLAIIWCLVCITAMAETALNFASQIKLKEAFKDTRKRERYLRYYERVPSARPFCIGLRVIGISALFLFFVFQSSSLDNQLLLYWLAPAIAAIAAELVGRSVGKRYSTHVLLILLPALQIPGLIAKRPVSHDHRSDASGVDKHVVPDEQIVDAAIEEIRVAIQDAASEGAIHHDERDMIEGVLEFEDVEVHEIMTPRTEMECIDINDKQENIRAHLADFHHTRIPIYEEVRDKVIGVLHVKDLVSNLMGKSQNVVPGLKGIMQPPFFVPETKRAMSLLHDFKQRHLQIAIILDEYGNMKPDVWTRHIRPALSTPGRPGEAIFIGVPEGRNHYYDLVEDAKDKEDWIALTWPTADINPEEAEAAKKDMDLLTWQQEYEGAFVSFEGRCYYAFGDWNIGQPNYNPNLPLIFCFDFNRCPGVAAVLQEQGDLTCIIDEIFITTNSNTEIVCDRLMSRWHKHKGEILLYGDASGGAKTSQAIDGSDWDIIERKIPQGISMYARANPKIRQRVNAVNSRLKSATGQVSLIVHENCKNIIKDFEGVICDDFGDPAKESGSMLTHISDAIGYYIYEEFPLEGNGLNRSAA